MKLPRPLGMLEGMKGWMRPLAPLAAALILAACVAPPRAVVVEPSAGAGAPRTAAPVAADRSYRVVRGDSLYAIAFRNGLDFRDLAAWNGIAAPYTIYPGQRLRLSAPEGDEGKPRRAIAAAARAHREPVPHRATPAFEAVPPSDAAASSSAAVAPAVAATTPVPPSHPAPAPLPPTPASPSPHGASRTVGTVTWRWPADGSLIKRFQSGDAIPGIELAGKAGDPVRAAADGVVVYSGNGLVGYGELIIIKHSDSFLSAYGHNRKRLVKEGQRVSAGQVIAEMGSTGASRDELQFQIRRDGNPVDPLDYLPAR